MKLTHPLQFFGILVAALLVCSCLPLKNPEQAKYLTVGVPVSWEQSLVPPLQHSGYATAILSNQFEALVNVGKGGKILPSLALNWEIKDGFREIVFKIDTSKKFSDGSRLKASDFKEAWEMGLKLIPRASRSSLADALGYIEGIDSFQEKGVITGIIAKNDKILILRFKKPFRTVLNFLASTSLSVFKKIGDRFIGTGPYLIKANTGKEILFEVNRYSVPLPRFKRVKIVEVSPKLTNVEMVNLNIDLVFFSETTGIKCKGDKNVACFSGLESGHDLLYLNSLEGRYFSDQDKRQMLQALFHEELSERLDRYDPQVYMPLQAGRLNEKSVNKIILSRKWDFQLLSQHTANKPLKLISPSDVSLNQLIFNILKKNNINFEVREYDDFGKFLEQFYKKHDFDLAVSASSVHHGDPDGIYHKLGKHGAISSPVLNRKSTAPLLEVGRTILDPTAIHDHYKKVTAAILTDVPFIHFGFFSSKVAYNKRKIRLSERFRERGDLTLRNFTEK